MAKDYARVFYNSKQWKDCRQAFISYRISIDGGMCEQCKKELGFIVHHRQKITPQTINDYNITLNHSNLEYVCKQCHDEEHFKDIHGKEREKPRYVFDSQGFPIMVEDEN